MRWFLVAIAVCWIAIGTWGNLYPAEAHARLRTLLERLTRRRLPTTIIALVLGIMLIVAAPASSQGVGFVRLLGVLTIAKAVVFVLLPRERYQQLFNWWFAPAREQSWRVWGLVMLVLGVVLLSWL